MCVSKAAATTSSYDYVMGVALLSRRLRSQQMPTGWRRQRGESSPVHIHLHGVSGHSSTCLSKVGPDGVYTAIV